MFTLHYTVQHTPYQCCLATCMRFASPTFMNIRLICAGSLCKLFVTCVMVHCYAAVRHQPRWVQHVGPNPGSVFKRLYWQAYHTLQSTDAYDSEMYHCI